MLTDAELMMVEIGKDAWVSGYAKCLQELIAEDMHLKDFTNINENVLTEKIMARFNLFISTEIDT